MKKTVSVLLILSVVIMMFSFNAFAADTPSMTLSDAVVKVGDQTCEFTLSIDSNPGIWSFYAYAFYPDEAVFSGFTAGDILPASSFFGPMGDDKSEMRDKSVQVELENSRTPDFNSIFNACSLSASDYRLTVIMADKKTMDNSEGNGTMCSFTLDVSGLPAGTYDIAVGCSKENTIRITPEYDCEYIDFGIAKATLTVEPLHMAGDVDGDGILSTRDFKLLSKHLLSMVEDDEIVFLNSDIDGDGYIGTKDSRLLQKLLLDIS